MKLSEALRRFRKAYKVTQKQAALSSGVSERIYQSYEYDKILPSIAVIARLADAYGVSVDYLIGRTDRSEINR